MQSDNGWDPDTGTISKKIERAKGILENPENTDRNILDIAYDVGFNSLRVFNRYFRKATDMGPVEYRAFHTQFRIVTGMSPEEYKEKHN